MEKIPEIFGCMVFSEEVMRERLPEEVYESLSRTIATGRTIDPSIANCVADAMKEWAIEKGATHYTHWFQPLTGVTSEKHEAFISPSGRCKVLMEFSGKELIRGETDASSFPTGGLRATFEARGYTAWDPASYAFVKDGSLFIPTAFCSYYGDALDTKTPLLRSLDAISTQAIRVLRLFGDTETDRVTAEIGAEQEYFLIDRKTFERRKDLFYTGRTLFGAHAPKGQELDDHYFGAIKPRVREFMQELDLELWKLGINAKTRHNEAAPSQHELAPVYTTTNLGVDQNLIIMEFMKKIADRHGLVCLLHEKPFEGVNGSGKHNNWSISAGGKSLFDAGKTPSENGRFLLMLAAVIQAVDDYQDLLRLSVVSASNDHRLGGYEAPPAIVSMFIGEDLEEIIDSIINGVNYNAAGRQMMDLGIPSIPVFRKDTTDRNRTSPFAFTGKKFEFRMPGSSQNVAMPNIVLNTAVAESFRQYADRLEKAENFNAELTKLLREVFTKHRRILFDGNGYSEEWVAEAERRGLLNLKDSPSVFPVLTLEKNVELFTRHGVMSATELHSREEILFENYAKIVNIEALTMIEMASRDIIPAVSLYTGKLADVINAKAKLGVESTVERELIMKLSGLNKQAYFCLERLKEAESAAASVKGARALAEHYRDVIIPAMDDLREYVDAMETITASSDWPYPNYGEVMLMV